ncbi:Cl-channel protein [Rhizoctonia solani AG-1 IA]|uniref:Cl-channel protein n=1 Tax=Thanatephorus cucumeris (strain AG1-IA) TaxID=983506 RepID=L8WIG0_THACA|nr:Cl-channel protein [Rhizoctonia solani AG-1 IA]
MNSLGMASVPPCLSEPNIEDGAYVSRLRHVIRTSCQSPKPVTFAETLCYYCVELVRMEGIRLEDTPRSDAFRQLHDAEELEQLRCAEIYSLPAVSYYGLQAIQRFYHYWTSRDIQSSLRDAQGGINPPWAKAQIQKLIATGQSWFVVSLVGACIGMNAALISIITEWLSDLKMGYCVDGWWLNQQFCCWEIDGEEESACASWRPWSAYSPGRYLVYVLLAVSRIRQHSTRVILCDCRFSDAVFSYLSAFGRLICKVCCWVRNLRDKVYHFWVRHERIFGIVNVDHKKSHTGKMREILTAASAAGVAVAFGSPIGGVMFSIEVDCFLAMNPFRTGKLGLYGVLVIKFNLQVAAFRRKHLVGYGVEEAVFLATITAIVSYFNRFLRIDMSESLGILFKECEGGGDYNNLCQSWAQWPMVNSLFLATLVRTVLVILSYGCKVPAGIFVPSMAIGATFGRMIGIIVKAMYTTYPTSSFFSSCRPDIPCITPGTYALLGAAAALSGIMRITVTVVVIMFELTGALTYILPTMVMTKAVGDCFGGARGIADEMIRFNGYPYLERDEHSFNIPVSGVMQRELHTMSITGMTLHEVEEKLEHTTVQGFPIVTTDPQKILIGYIGRTELRYAIGNVGKARRTRDIHPSTLCNFEPPSIDESQAHDATVDTDVVRELAGVEEDDHAGITPLAASADIIQFGPWVNQTPLCVGPQLPLEIVTDLFNRMGPRVILVEHHGSLAGLITVKDVLRFMASSEHAHSATGSVWDNPGELDALLEEAWLWAGNLWRSILATSRLLIGTFILQTKKEPQVTRSSKNANYPTIMLLYWDLFIMISEYLREDLDSLCHLCLACRHTHAAATQVLYRNVMLHRPRAIEMFCTTILEGTVDLCSIPQYLWIGPGYYHRHPEVVYLVSRLRRTLNLLPNLRDLTFTPTAKSFGEIYSGLLECPFKLKSLSAPYHTNTSLVQFLQTQPSIETLSLYDLDTEPPRAPLIVEHINCIAAQGTFLPNLKFLSADPRVLSALVAGKPISHVEISVGSRLSSEPEVLRHLVEALAQTSVPLISLKHNLRTMRIHLWGTKFLRQLGTTRIKSTLETLSVRLPIDMRPLFLGHRSELLYLGRSGANWVDSLA